MLPNVLKFFVQPVWVICVVFQAANREIGPTIVQKNQRVFVVGWPFQSSLLCSQRCIPVDVACFAYCARADWANVDILGDDLSARLDRDALQAPAFPHRTHNSFPLTCLFRSSLCNSREDRGGGCAQCRSVRCDVQTAQLSLARYRCCINRGRE